MLGQNKNFAEPNPFCLLKKIILFWK